MNMKKILCCALSCVLLLTALVIPTAADVTGGYDASKVAVVDLTDIPDIKTLATSDAKGFDVAAYVEGTAWKISDAAGMLLFSMIVNSSTVNSGERYHFKGKTVYLEKDINMASVANFQPIGDAVAYSIGGVPAYPIFRGTFDGQGHTISNLTVTSSADENASVALFGVIVGARIRNLILDSSCSFSYTGGSILARTAAVVAWAHSASDEYNEYKADLNADMSVESDPTRYNDETAMPVSFMLENIRNDANVTSTGYAGGILGAMSANSNLTPIIRNCTNNGAVKGTIGAAGMVGYMTKRHLLMENCVNAGNITSTYHAAGLIYNTENDNITKKVWLRNCVVTGEVTGDEAAALVIMGANIKNQMSLDLGSAEKNTLCDGSAATVKVVKAEAYSGYGTEAVDYSGKLIGYVPAASTEKNLDDVYPICVYLDLEEEVNEFKISTPDDLAYFAYLVNAGEPFDGYTIYLENDLNMAGVEMAPIGSPTGGAFLNKDQVKNFQGTFDGQGHVIDNLVMSAAVTPENAEGAGKNYAVMGLFGVIRSATIKNVILGSGCSFSLTSTSAADVEPCVAALVAFSYRKAGNEAPYGTIENCYSAASVNGSHSVGGFIGWVDGNTDIVAGVAVRNCTNAGNVTGGVYAGGIVGYMTDRSASILNCRNTGTVTLAADQQTESSGAAGICARPNSTKLVKIDSCINNGLIKGPGTLGGIVAIENQTSVSISNCTNAGSFMCTTDATGTVGPIYGINTTPCTQMMNNADLTGKTDVTLTTFTVTTDFPNYAEIEEAHKKALSGGDVTTEENPVTNAPTQEETNAPTEEVTNAPTEKVTEAPTEETPGTTEAPEEKKGCGATISGALALLLMLSAAGVSVCKKKD